MGIFFFNIFILIEILGFRDHQILIIGFILLLGGFFVAGHISKERLNTKREHDALRFKKVTGHITGTRIDEVSAYPEDGLSWRAIITYKYKINGISREKEQDISSFLFTSFKFRAKKDLTGYDVGDSITVYVNPDDNNDSFILT